MLQDVSTSHPSSPQEGDDGDSRPFLIGSLFAVVIMAAIVPAYVHVVYVVGRWSWQLIG